MEVIATETPVAAPEGDVIVTVVTPPAAEADSSQDSAIASMQATIDQLTAQNSELTAALAVTAIAAQAVPAADAPAAEPEVLTVDAPDESPKKDEAAPADVPAAAAPGRQRHDWI